MNTYLLSRLHNTQLETQITNYRCVNEWRIIRYILLQYDSGNSHSSHTSFIKHLSSYIILLL